MMRAVRAIVGAVVVLLLVLFALSNRQVVQLVLWPTDLGIDAPISAAVLVAALMFFFAGALLAWGSNIALRRRARRAEASVRQLESQVQALQAQPSFALPPPGS